MITQETYLRQIKAMRGVFKTKMKSMKQQDLPIEMPHSELIWKSVSGFSNRYEVSVMGVLRLAEGDLVSSRKDKDGYRIATLWDHKQYHTVKVHRIVLETFLGIDDEKLQVDHINRIKDDNRLCNLRWVTAKENNENKLYFCRAKSGVKGVRFRENRPTPWQAYINIKGIFMNLGHYPTKEEAEYARSIFN